MRTRSDEAVVLLISVLALLSLAPMAEAQVATPDYVVLDTERTSTMQEELQTVADNGYRLVPGQGSWGPTAILERVLDPEPIEYLLLATSKTGTLQDEIDEAATEGYRLASVLGKGDEAVVVMRRAPGLADPTHEYVVLGTKRAGTMEEELLAAATNGFRLVGQSHYNSPSSEAVAILFDLPEMVAILERPLQIDPRELSSQDVRPTQHEESRRALGVRATQRRSEAPGRTGAVGRSHAVRRSPRRSR